MATKETTARTLLLLSVDKCAHALDCGRAILFRCLYEQKFHRVKFGRKAMIPFADLAVIVAILTKEAAKNAFTFDIIHVNIDNIFKEFAAFLNLDLGRDAWYDLFLMLLFVEKALNIVYEISLWGVV